MIKIYIAHYIKAGRETTSKVYAYNRADAEREAAARFTALMYLQLVKG